MKTLKYILSFALVLLIGCAEDDTDLRFLEEVPAPSDITALFQVTQDNTGTVTITPNGSNAVSYNMVTGLRYTTRGLLLGKHVVGKAAYHTSE